jgi:arginine:agmatine antiporter
MLLVATTMVGSAIFLLPATLASIGTISLLGWLVAGSGALLIGLTLGALSAWSADGFLDAIGVILGPLAGQAAALLYFLAYPPVLAAIALAAAGNLAFLVPALSGEVPTTLVASAFLLLLAGLAQFGARPIGRFGSLTLFLGALPILLVATAGWAFFDGQLFRDGWNVSGGSNASALFEASLLCFFSFLGLETASVISRHMKNPRRDVPIATVGGILISAAIYISATTAIAGMLPAAALAASTAPFADATLVFLGQTAAMIVAVAAAAKALGTLGTSQLGGTESWLCLQRQLRLRGLSFGAANALVALLALLATWVTAAPRLASQYGQLVSAVVVITLLVFALSGVALARAGRGLPRLAGAAAAIFALGLIAVQPVQDIWLAIVTTLVCTIPLAALRLWRGAPAVAAAATPKDRAA